MRLRRTVFNLEKVLLIRVWKISNPQCPISKLALLLYFRDSCNASTKYAWAKQPEISFLCDSREARFQLRRFDFTQKVTCLSKAWSTANSIWTAFGANSWDENWSSEEKLPMHSDPQMKMDCGHSNKMGMELSVNEIGRSMFVNPHKARVFPPL